MEQLDWPSMDKLLAYMTAASHPGAEVVLSQTNNLAHGLFTTLPRKLWLADSSRHKISLALQHDAAAMF